MDAEHFIRRVLKQYQNFKNTRAQEITHSFIQHMSDFIVDAQITKQEWEAICQDAMDLASHSVNNNKNDFILFAEILGLSQLVEGINNRRPSNTVGSALLGPCYRANSPQRKLGDPIMSKDTEGARVNIRGRIIDKAGRVIPGAALDVWQAANNGLYDVQDPRQQDMNLRGIFIADDQGHFHFTTIMPKSYPVPIDGPLGKFLDIANRKAFRPAHIHFIISAPEYETLITQIFIAGDPMIEKDVVFTADNTMVGNFESKGDYFELEYDFQLIKGIQAYPKASIQ